MLPRLDNIRQRGGASALKHSPTRPWLELSKRFFGLLIVAVLLLLGANLHAADVSLCQITKGIKYLQTNSSTPAEIFPNGYPFSAQVIPVVPNWVTAASVQSPGTYSSLSLELSGTRYEWDRSFNTLAGLDANYANGVYLLKMKGVHDGLRQLQMPLLGSTYPNVPRVSNFRATQRVFANGYCLLTWDRFIAGRNSDLIRFTVQDANGKQYYQTANIGEQQALNGMATWILLEPGRLQPNSNYLAKLKFQKNVALDRSSYPGALGVAAYTAETQFKLVTLASAGPAIKQIELAKSLRWVQSADAPPEPEKDHAQFSITAKAYETSNVPPTASLLLPAGATLGDVTLALQPDNVTLRYVYSNTTSAGLDEACGLGTYTLNLSNRQDGAKSLTFNVQSVDNAPPPPQVIAYNSLQSVRAGKPLTVSWFPWTDGTVNDFIQLSIRDSFGNKVFETPDLGSPNALHGLTTNALVPAGALAFGSTNDAQLMFRRNASLDTTNYPGVLSLADYHSQTRFQIVTALVEPPVLRVAWSPLGKELVFSAEVVSNQSYQVDYSTNLPLWMPLLTNSSSSNILWFTDHGVSSRLRTFYRIRTWP